MMVRFTFVVALVLVASPLLAQQRPAQSGGSSGGSAGIREKASYSFGMMIGNNLKRQGVDVDVNLFIQGLKDASSGGKLQLTEEQATEAIQAFEQEMSAKRAQESKDFLVQNAKRPGVQTTASGLQYKVVKAGNGPKPTARDAVTVVYRGLFINGQEFDSSGGKPFTIGVADVIPGWQEALQLMPVGSKWHLFVPADLAYGEQGQPPIGPNMTLVFELELVNVSKAPATGALPAQPKFK